VHFEQICTDFAGILLFNWVLAEGQFAGDVKKVDDFFNSRLV